MGLFLSASGIIGAPLPAVVGALREFVSAKGGRFEPTTMPTDYWDVMVITESGRNVTVMYPGDFFEWQSVSAYLSESLRAPVFFLHIHDGDLWMYELYVNGTIVDQFNPIPDYWSDEMTEEEMQAWAGNAAVIAEWCPGVRKEAIERYLIRWDLDDLDRPKAYTDDEFGSEDWQMVDFMGKVGLPYPVDREGKCRGDAFQFSLCNSRSRHTN